MVFVNVLDKIVYCLELKLTSKVNKNENALSRKIVGNDAVAADSVKKLKIYLDVSLH